MNSSSELWRFACSKNGYQNIQLLMEQMPKQIPENVRNLAKYIYHIKVNTEITIIISILIIANTLTICHTEVVYHSGTVITF